MNACMIGNPVGHSILPKIIKLISEKYNLDINFISCMVESKDKLKDAIVGIKSLNFTAFDITHPYKKEIIQYLDYLDPKAKAIGAVDTVVIKDGKLYGYNYNSTGAIKSIEEEGRKINPNDKLVVIGEGGCSRAVCFEVYTRTKNLVIINRFLEEANDLKKDLVDLNGEGVKIYELNEQNLKKELVNANFILHTTPVGMNPAPNKTLIDKKIIDYLVKLKGTLNNVIFWDSIYSPSQTLFLKHAKEGGAKTINGLGMLKNELPMLMEAYYGKKIDLDSISEEIDKLVLDNSKI